MWFKSVATPGACSTPERDGSVSRCSVDKIQLEYSTFRHLIWKFIHSSDKLSGDPIWPAAPRIAAFTILTRCSSTYSQCDPYFVYSSRNWSLKDSVDVKRRLHQLKLLASTISTNRGISENEPKRSMAHY